MRARALSVIRAYFTEQRFLEVVTPVRVSAPGVDRNVEALRAEGGFLITSPEHHLKRLLAGGLPRVFELAHCTRGGELGPLHEPEFTMLEWYRAFAGQEDVMRDTEQVVERVVRSLTGSTRVAFADGRRVDVRPPYPRISVCQAFRRYAAIADAIELAERDEAQFFELLVGARRARPRRPLAAGLSVRLPRVTGSAGPAVTQKPEGRRTLRALSRRRRALQRLRRAHRSGRAAAPPSGRARRSAAASKRRTYPLDRQLIAALAEGMPPAGGNALGVDRLVMLAAGAKSIADVQAFPEPLR